jgi:hypothetical protein
VIRVHRVHRGLKAPGDTQDHVESQGFRVLRAPRVSQVTLGSRVQWVPRVSRDPKVSRAPRV